MPNITLPVTFANGTALSSAGFETNLFVPRSTSPASLAVVNGELDLANLDSVQVTRWMLQRGEFTAGEQHGFNLPLDYFQNLWTGFVELDASSGSNEADNTEAFRPIPGCCATHFFRWEARYTLVLWRVFCSHDGEHGNAAEVPVFRFFRDGTYVSGHRRAVPPHVFSSVRYQAAQQREWSGAALVENLGYGWHDFSLRLASSAQQARLYNGSMAVIGYRGA